MRTSESTETLLGDALRSEAHCPWCDSTRNRIASAFGGTVSEILFQCLDCGNPFGLMKWETLKEST